MPVCVILCLSTHTEVHTEFLGQFFGNLRIGGFGQADNVGPGCLYDGS